MSEVNQAVENLRNFQVDQRKLVDMRDAAERLATNPDFRKLILDGFCLTEAARYAQESGDPLLTDRQRADALNMCQASGHLKRFLQLVCTMGNTAADNIQKAEHEIDSILEHGLEGDE